MIKKCLSCKKWKKASHFYHGYGSCKKCYYIKNGFKTKTSAQKLKYAETKKRWRTSLPNSTLNRARLMALKRRGGNMTTKDLIALWHRQSGKCAISGVQMTFANGTGRVSYSSVTIDRKNNNKPYDISNVQLLCHAVNSFKGTMSNRQTVALAKKIVENYVK